MKKRRILVTDDEPDLCDILEFNLTAAGYDTTIAHSAEEAMQHDMASFDLLLLDVMMDGMSGFELARMLKADSRTAAIPIIFLTARDTEADTLHGFRLGADDYVSKPFSVREVVARVKAVLNRTEPAAGAEPGVALYEGLQMDAATKTVCVDGKPTSFTRTEFALLWLLLTHQGVVFSRQQLLERVWPDDVIVTDRTVDVNITRVRKKIARYASCIATRQRFGYGFIIPHHNQTP